jgi:hypothetical protein
MLQQKHEIPFLRQTLLSGKIDGTSYEKECACFIGTIAKAAKCKYDSLPNLKPDSNSPTEKWFYSIRKGDTPENHSIAKVTLGWIDEFLKLIE